LAYHLSILPLGQRLTGPESQTFVQQPFTAAIAVAVFASCSSGDRVPSVVLARDSAGVSIIESSAPQWPAGAESRIGDVSIQFESVDVAGVFGAVRLDNGASVLGEEGGARLLYFGADGALRRSVGRRGEGPGEFRLPQFLGHTGDTVWVYDYAQSRVTRFDAAGELIDIVNLTPPLPSALAVGSLPDGSLVFMGQWRSNVARNAQGLTRDTVAVVRYRNGVRAATVATIPGREFVQRAEAGGRMVMSVAIFARRASAAIWGDAIVLGAQMDHSLRVVGSDGRDRQVIRWSGPDLTLTAGDVARWVDAQLATAPRTSASGYVLFATAPVPEKQPAYGRILADASGHLWVSEYAAAEAEPSRWDVFAPDGTWLGPIRVPEHFRPLEIGRDWVLGVRLDSLDTQHLELRTLRSWQ
jgi:hypothetical protein